MWKCWWKMTRLSPSAAKKNAAKDRVTIGKVGAAHGALAMTTPGDTSMATKADVERLVGGGSARVDR